MWEPIIKENKLYGLSLNPLEKPDKNKMQGLRFAKEIIRWQKAEVSRRLVGVDEAEYQRQPWSNGIRYASFPSGAFIESTFTADELNGKLINLKVI